MTRAALCKGIAWMTVSLLAGCGGAASPSSAESRSYSSGGTASESAPASATVQSDVTTTHAPTPPPQDVPRTSVTTTGGGTTMESGEQMAYWQHQLDRASQSLSTTSDCRDICRASGDICVAASEICGLTGDAAGSPTGDVRCSRARSACEGATRQRNGSCPVCPRD